MQPDLNHMTSQRGSADRFDDASPDTSSASIVCILNLTAGTQSDAMRDRVSSAFAAQGTPAHIWIAEDGGELVALADRAISEGHGIVVAGGGDGTINCIAGKVLEAGRILGILPRSRRSCMAMCGWSMWAR
jgi:hypothetical protein